jgi:CRISPR-associated endonuclease/helicase Cas3
MVVNLSDYKSHPHKELTDHSQGVMDNVKQLTSSKLAALAALFHDLGKLNPNFQDKLFNKPNKGYSSHAFLSSFGLLCFCTKNQAWLKKELGDENFQFNFLALLVIIAKHHGNLPDFELPFGGEESKECNKLFKFIEKNSTLPVTEFIQFFEPTIAEYSLIKDVKIQENYAKLALTKKPSDVLDYYLSTQYDFSCLIQSDKTDAGDYKLDREDVATFCGEYNVKLSDYLGKLKGDTPLNQLRKSRKSP